MTAPTIRTETVSAWKEEHRPLLDRAMRAVADREYWNAYEEDRAAYGPDAEKAGERLFREQLDRPFELEQPGTDGWVGPGGERSPFGFDLGVSYPHSRPEVLLPAVSGAAAAWAEADPWTRAAVCAETLSRINADSHAFAHAAAHTSGQGSLMAFHAGAAHAQDRGLEAVAQILSEQTRLPDRVLWRKPTGQGWETLTKSFSSVPRGTGLVVGGAVVPVWNTYPGLFASLAAGNGVVVKPHPRAVLPLAMTVRTARQVLREAGFSPNTVCLAVERPGEELARVLARRPEVRVVDYTGTSAFGEWLEENCPQAFVFTQKSAVNPLLVESTDDYSGLVENLAFTLALYSGRLCTAPQNLFVPEAGIATDQGHRSLERFVGDVGDAVTGLLSDGAPSAELLGAIGDESVLEAWDRAASGALGEVLYRGPRVTHPAYPEALFRSPLLVRAAPGANTTLTEYPGPVGFVVPTASAEEALRFMGHSARTGGTLTAGLHTTDVALMERAERFAREYGVHLSVNLTGPWLLTQSSVFSDVHGSGANPASNSADLRGAFLTSRFTVVGVRRRIRETG
ncbi:phenylacetic acid degradation protein PaaN [Nocardiopsis sp. NPDC049922]|uniref:phenylacetic acid degradation protein PaaN n=1 Tax=Nocardiopsis sp. NPDC049922 TaxID=3155157 RepID=UPI0033E2E2CF